MRTRLDLSRPNRRRAMLRAFIMIAASTLSSLTLTVLAMTLTGVGLHPFGIIASVVLPLVIGGPLTVHHALQRHKLHLANVRLARQASIDYLTGVLNRRAFAAQVQSHIDQAKTSGAPGVGVFLLIDADRFKLINDTFGHDAGDRALRLIADMIVAETEPRDLVARAGGEEFAVLLADKSLAQARQVSRRICARLAAVDFVADGSHHPLSVSIGGTRVGIAEDFTSVYRRADAQLYKAKENAPACIMIESRQCGEGQAQNAA